VRISRTTLYRTVAGTTPGREFTDEVPTKVIQPGQSEVKPEPLVGVSPPEPVAPPLGDEGSQPPRDPAIVPVEQRSAARTSFWTQFGAEAVDGMVIAS
jgi:hypothetical protein